jgi:hypothetical protein
MDDPESLAGDLCEPGPDVDDLAAMRQVAREELAKLLAPDDDPDDLGLSGAYDRVSICRAVARQEIASAAGLVLRRLQEYKPMTASVREHLEAGGTVERGYDANVIHWLSTIWGELLRDFTTKSEPGES